MHSSFPLNSKNTTQQYLEVPSPALESQQPQAVPQAGGREAGKLPGGNGSGGAG